jgi:hypothetical protein
VSAISKKYLSILLLEVHRAKVIGAISQFPSHCLFPPLPRDCPNPVGCRIGFGAIGIAFYLTGVNALGQQIAQLISSLSRLAEGYRRVDLERQRFLRFPVNR